MIHFMLDGPTYAAMILAGTANLSRHTYPQLLEAACPLHPSMDNFFAEILSAPPQSAARAAVEVAYL